MRESTRWKPSSAMSRPATQPSMVERNIRRAIRVMIRTRDHADDRAHEAPAEGRRCRRCLMPIAMIHLPSGGCTTKSRVRVEDVARVVGLGAPLDAVLEQLLALGGVVDLVEDQTGRVGEVDEPQDRRDRHDPGRRRPRRQLPRRHRIESPADVIGDRRLRARVLGRLLFGRNPPARRRSGTAGPRRPPARWSHLRSPRDRRPQPAQVNPHLPFTAVNAGSDLSARPDSATRPAKVTASPRPVRRGADERTDLPQHDRERGEVGV